MAPASSFSFHVQRGSIAGIAEVRVEEVSGAARGVAMQAFRWNPAWSFDFNTATSATAPGSTGVGALNTHHPGVGYGWQTNAPTFVRSQIASPLLSDGHWGTSNTYLVNAENGTYLMNVTLGDGSFARNQIVVVAEGQEKLSGLSTAAGQFLHRSFEVEVTDGLLQLQIYSAGGDPYFTINALQVLQTSQVSLTFEIDGTAISTVEGVADGTTVDTIMVHGATAGALHTVAADLGTIQGMDADPYFAGFQVLASGTSFPFQVMRPTGVGTGTPQIHVEEVTGLRSGRLLQSYSLVAARRFDFNGPSNDTHTVPVGQVPYQGVRGSALYDAAVGFGWSSRVSEFERTGVSDALRRDGHWGSAARTFQVSVEPSVPYDLQVTIGDANFARDNIQISVDGGATWTTADSTARNEFATVQFEGITSGSNVLSVIVRNHGGDPYWVVNALEIWESAASEPAELVWWADPLSSQMVGPRSTAAMIEPVVQHPGSSDGDMERAAVFGQLSTEDDEELELVLIGQHDGFQAEVDEFFAQL